MDSVRPGTSGFTGPVTRKRRQLEETEEKRREKEEMAKKVRKNTKTSFIEVDVSTGKIKTEVKQEPEVDEEQNVVVVKEEVEVLMDNAGGAGDEEDLGGISVDFQESTGPEFPAVAEGMDVVGGAQSTQSDLGAEKVDVYSGCQLLSRISVGLGTDLLASHYVPLEEFTKLKEESDKRLRALEAGFQALQRQLDVYFASTPKADQPMVDVLQEKEPGPGSALMDNEKLNDSSGADLEEAIAVKNCVEVAVIEVPRAVLPALSTGGNSTEPEDDRTLTLFPEGRGGGGEAGDKSPPQK